MDEIERVDPLPSRSPADLNSMVIDDKRNRRSRLSRDDKLKYLIIVAILIILLIFIIIFIAKSYKLNNLDDVVSDRIKNNRSLDLLKILDGEYIPKGFNGSWISDNEILYKDSFGSLSIYNVSSANSTILVKDLFKDIPGAFSYTLSADRKFLLVGYNYNKIYRHSFIAQFRIIKINERVPQLEIAYQGIPKQLQLAIWAPKGNALAYVFMNNIYYVSDVEFSFKNFKEVTGIKLTSTGVQKTVFNGVADWVYEEEVFSSTKALWFSKNGNKLAFASFNDTNVEFVSIPYYGTLNRQNNSFAAQYTAINFIRYPKTGTSNPIVTLNIVDLTNIKMVENIKNEQTFEVVSLPTPPELAYVDPILKSVAWASDTELVAVWMNRTQNIAKIVLCSMNNTKCENIRTLQEPEGWVELISPLLISNDGKRMIYIYGSDQENNAGKYRHIIQTDLQHNGISIPLTNGMYEVQEILKWDENNKVIYFTSNTEASPSQLRINTVSDNSSLSKTHCVGCNTSRLDGGKCLYNGASFSNEGSYYMSTCAGPGAPEIRLFDKNGNEIIVWESNYDLKQSLSKIDLPTKMDFKVRLVPEFESNVRLLLPPNMDYSGNTKYPLIMNVYGGPDFNIINDIYSIDFSTYLGVMNDFIIGLVDGRNSGNKGDKNRFAGYRRFGTVEVADTLNATRFIQNSYSYVDKNRTGIWGWSYGGYLTIKALENDFQNIFKCGVAVAPVTDWILYDSIYTERYMGLLEDNYEGYDDASVFYNVTNLKTKDFYLIHGTLDDNVHYQNSMLFSKILERQDILFNQISYPDEEHALQHVQPHLYHSMEHFFKRCFK